MTPPGFWADHATGAVPIGLRAGLFHPTTGYSLPVAVESPTSSPAPCR